MRPTHRGDFSTDTRLLGVTLAAAVVGILSTVGAYLLLKLIRLFTNLSFFSNGPWRRTPLRRTGWEPG